MHHDIEEGKEEEKNYQYYMLFSGLYFLLFNLYILIKHKT
jgi:hypothetical protein